MGYLRRLRTCRRIGRSPRPARSGLAADPREDVVTEPAAEQKEAAKRPAHKPSPPTAGRGWASRARAWADGSAMAAQPTSARHDDAMPSRCRRTRRGSLLCYLAGALCGVTLVLGPDQGGHVPVVLRRCRGKTAVCHSDLCCYLIQRQRGHACIIAATRRCGHRLAACGRACPWILDDRVRAGKIRAV